MDQAEAHRRYFDTQADSYDEYTAAGAWIPNEYLAGVLGKLVADKVEVRTALDLGSGTGQTLEVVRAAFPHATLWASDVSAAMLQRAAIRVPDAHFEVADISTHVAGLTESFDLVTAIGCLELVSDLMDVLPRLIQHVHPGGHLALTIEPLIDGLGAERERSGDEQRWSNYWSTARVLQALPGGELRSSHLFTAYQRADRPVIYELMLIRKAA
ncbi:MAG: methyltransferase [Jatrophihabitantaceae bacterium]